MLNKVNKLVTSSLRVLSIVGLVICLTIVGIELLYVFNKEPDLKGPMAEFYEQHTFRTLVGNYGIATAVAVNKKYALTNEHVCSADITRLSNPDSTEFYKISKKVVSAVETRDLCLVVIEGEFKSYVEISDNFDKVGSIITSSGFPLGKYTVISGRIATEEISIKLTTDIHPRVRQITSMIISPGSSGSGVFNTSGKLVGIVAEYLPSVLRPYQGISYIMPLKEIKLFLNEEKVIQTIKEL